MHSVYGEVKGGENQETNKKGALFVKNGRNKGEQTKITRYKLCSLSEGVQS